MLRVRPIIYVSDLEAWSSFLEAVGLIRTVDGPDLREFDAGGGRIALRRKVAPGESVVVFGVEVGDPAEFARRTLADGTEAVVVEGGLAAEVTGRDGFVFRADKAAHGATCADADPALSVVGVWLTPYVKDAATDLRNIGARPREAFGVGADAGKAPAIFQEADFTTKNGGILAARTGRGSDGAEADGASEAGASGASDAGAGSLEFEYAGRLDDFRQRLAQAGVEALVAGASQELSQGRALELLGPGGVKVIVRASPRA